MYAVISPQNPNKVYLSYRDKGLDRRPIPNMPPDFSVDTGGLIQSPSLSTNRNGECIVVTLNLFFQNQMGLTADITATISGTNKSR